MLAFCLIKTSLSIFPCIEQLWSEGHFHFHPAVWCLCSISELTALHPLFITHLFLTLFLTHGNKHLLYELLKILILHGSSEPLLLNAPFFSPTVKRQGYQTVIFLAERESHGSVFRINTLTKCSRENVRRPLEIDIEAPRPEGWN